MWTCSSGWWGRWSASLLGRERRRMSTSRARPSRSPCPASRAVRWACSTARRRRCCAARRGGRRVAAVARALDSAEVREVLDRLTREDVVGQLLQRRGRMAELATEAGDVKLAWVDQVAWALDHPDAIDGVETLAKSIRSRFAHVIWSGMGGSIQAVHTLKGMGLLGSDGLSLHPLDSTDPAALNRLLRA